MPHLLIQLFTTTISFPRYAWKVIQTVAYTFIFSWRVKNHILIYEKKGTRPYQCYQLIPMILLRNCLASGQSHHVARDLLWRSPRDCCSPETKVMNGASKDWLSQINGIKCWWQSAEPVPRISEQGWECQTKAKAVLDGVTVGKREQLQGRA